jgi:hypothetical protein
MSGERRRTAKGKGTTVKFGAMREKVGSTIDGTSVGWYEGTERIHIVMGPSATDETITLKS